jgi:hypothetical protein
MATTKQKKVEEAKKILSASANYSEGITDADKQYYRDLLIQLNKDDKNITTVSQAASERYQQQFGALSQKVLASTVKEIQKQQKKEYEFNLIKGMPGLSEIFGMGESLTNSLLGDSGLGGYLSMMGGGSSEDIKKGLQSSLGLGTGVGSQNSTSYNWQKWFDEKLTEEARQGSEGLSKEELEEQKKFAEDYINTYLRPRFDFSKSMGEFKSYLSTDISSPEFQKEVINQQAVQDAYKNIAEKRNEEFLTQLLGRNPSGFDSNFYFSPGGNEDKQASYSVQKGKVQQDWEAAKAGKQTNGIDWKKQALAYGVDIKNKDQFAKLHYELYGKNNNFDGAKDAISKEVVANYIKDVLVPALKEADVDMKTNAFKNYVSPQEFADGILSDLTGNRSWDQYMSDVLGVKPPTPLSSDATDEQKQQYSEALASYEERKKSITEQVGEDPLAGLRDDILSFYYEQGEGNIREQIEKMKKDNIVPTQKNLGITYIERETDKATEKTQGTALYEIFKKSGYEGDEDTFYNEMFPDVSKEDQQLMTDVLSGKPLTEMFDISDPFSFDPDAIFGKMSFFEEKDKETPKETDSYFTLDKGIGIGQTTKKSQDVYSDFGSSFSQFGFL